VTIHEENRLPNVDDETNLNDLVLKWNPAPTFLEDPMSPLPAAALAAALDQSPADSVLPPLWHWVHFLEWAPTGELASDGHPREGATFPPIPDRTRMFVGGRLEMYHSLRLGAIARRRSEVTNSIVKVGRSGPMLFVTVRHEIEQAGALAIVDEQDYMYRSGASSRRSETVSGDKPPSDAEWQEPFTADPVLLFRFSALTANSHRIHYDQPYATGVEKYPGLVVHGPLLAIVMANFASRIAPNRVVTNMTYRFNRPCFASDSLLLTSNFVDDHAELAVLAVDGGSNAQGELTYA
jgi:3-methylfumaryl-CoA hydratase